MGHFVLARASGLRAHRARPCRTFAHATRGLYGSNPVHRRDASEKAAAGSKFRSPPPRHRAIRKPRATIPVGVRCGAPIRRGGGDELSVPTKEFCPIYDRAAQMGLHRLMHAGEVGGPEKIREAIELLGAERIGHGIAAINDPGLMDFLAERKIPLEICPASNIKTAALAKQLRREDARIEDHPLPKLLRHGIPVVLSTDDPAMFHTTLHEEYVNAARMGLQEDELARIVEMSFEHSFLPPGERGST